MTRPLSQGPFLAGLALITSATLALEVLDTRLLSVLTWYSFAFFVIAMGLCGLTAGAVRVYLSGERYRDEMLGGELARAALLFALAVILHYVLLLAIPLRVAPVATSVAVFMLFSIALALPFYPAGIVVAAAVTRTSFPVGRVYAVDLLGAALGAPLVPAVLSQVDCGTAIIGTGVIGALAAICFARAGGDRKAMVRAGRVAIALAALTILNQSTDYGLRPLWVKERPEVFRDVERVLWNSHSRVEVYRAGPQPAMVWGLGSKCLVPIVTQRMLFIDAHAASPLYHADEKFESLRFLECDVTDVANILRPGGPSTIIGVGGSRDVQAALLAGHAPVVGIEINGLMLDILRGPWGKPTRVANHPAVTLVHDDGRSFLMNSKDHFRVIQASLIDTWAATGAGAHALSENGLYTIEAWKSFFDRLEPGGVFTVTRSTADASRMVVLAMATLLERGATRPREHIALLGVGVFATLVVGREPLTVEDAGTLRRLADARGFTWTIVAGVRNGAEHLEKVLVAKSRSELDAVTVLKDLDFRPPTDDRPFFFNAVRPSAFLKKLPHTLGALDGNLLATRMLSLALLSSFALATAFILVPLARRARPAGRVSRSLIAAFSYFTLIGVGFMMVEIALLQRLSLLLGQPLYSLVVVLSSLVAAAGLGSLASDRLRLDRKPLCYVYPLVLAGWVAALALGWSRIAPAVMTSPTTTRIAVAAATAALTGLPLGLAFPTGMRLASRLHGDETPWLWGLNGAGSVVASSLALLVALAWGLTTVTLCGAACYALLLPAVLVITRAVVDGTDTCRSRDDEGLASTHGSE